MTCLTCDCEIEGELSMCASTCICKGTEGTITHNGEKVGAVYSGDKAYHTLLEDCIGVLLKKVALLESFLVATDAMEHS